jgi:hypothetical protein
MVDSGDMINREAETTLIRQSRSAAGGVARLGLLLFAVFLVNSAFSFAHAAGAKRRPASAGGKRSANKATTTLIAQRAKVISDGAMVYKEADFDSPVILYLNARSSYWISKKRYGPFYRIMYKVNGFGYIADTDVQTQSGGNESAAGKEKDPKEKGKSEAMRAKKKHHGFDHTRYMGLQFASIPFSEETAGRNLTENLSFYGVSLFGPRLLTDGETLTQIDFLLHKGAPSYYDKLTDRLSDGVIVLTDFLLVTPIDANRNRMLTFGFGPFFRYSRFAIRLPPKDLDMQDLRLGAAFDLGLGFRIGNWALRADLKYYWEKSKYWAYVGAVQYEF